ncbi:deoxyribose-phosphate aldolase [Propylenella binzhouense]|uniref:Deoxyribose-phosphate aldolase n=1 Tax=Propylenella binzhouense TaxID=2555902 RepID=A0A964T6F4_9HYPH|nr:deoxyribose-phosphate aldolase [Propylenella binzhouense]MYZ48689.1 deoxyribose-phosphate aldolase [Propylenella binzhouense]
MTADERKALARRALACLDLTDLSDGCTPEDVERLCERALTAHGPVAAVCIWPRFVAQAVARLGGSPVRVAAVANFPAGGEDIDAAAAEAEAAVAAGADEIDMVMAWRLVATRPEHAEAEIVRVCEAIGDDVVLKVILETGELKEEKLIRRAAEIAARSGADFIKTSTGKVPVNATPEAARTMLGVIAEYSGEIGFKAAGGIRTLDDAAVYFGLATEILGPDWPAPERFRIGASGLLDALLAELGGGPAAADADGY